jgi:hypothetical protein
MTGALLEIQPFSNIHIGLVSSALALRRECPARHCPQDWRHGVEGNNAAAMLVQNSFRVFELSL